jgi:triacylglycerol lipase
MLWAGARPPPPLATPTSPGGAAARQDGGVRWFAGLSPRRRLLVGGLAVLVLVLAATLVVRGAGGLGTRRAVPAQDRPGPVLLVPGYGGNTTAMDALAQMLRDAGRPATVGPLPGDGTGDLNGQAAALEGYVRGELDAGAPSVDIVGHSAGGIVARLWVQEHDGAHKARRVVTLGSPHHGAEIAAAGAASVPGACPAACQQLVPGSRLLTGLTTPVVTPPAWLAVLTTQDQTVTPPESARLEGAVNVVVQDVCPGRQVSHGGLPTDPFVASLVIRAVGDGPLAAPPPGEC